MTLILAMGVPVLSPWAQGEEVKTPKHDETRPATPAGARGVEASHRRPHLGSLERATQVLGAEVNDARGEKLGKVRELAVDLESGRVVEAMVAKGGVLGVGEKWVAVPVSALRRENAGPIVLEVDRERWLGAPEFSLESWADQTQSERITARHRYFGVDSPITPDYRPQSDGAVPPATEKNPRTLARIERASKVIGLPVTSEAGEKIGKVDDLLVDLAAGRLVEVVVSTGGFLGVGDELSGIPPSVFRYDIEGGKVALHVSKEALQSAPRFKDAEWAAYSKPDRVREVYRAYGVKPYFDPHHDADNTGRNVRDRDSQTLTPLDQGNSSADVKISADIRRELGREDGLSVSARNVKIITVQGRVTLRGPVRSASEKQKVEEIAQRIAGVDRVFSQLEVLADNSAQR